MCTKVHVPGGCRADGTFVDVRSSSPVAHACDTQEFSRMHTASRVMPAGRLPIPPEPPPEPPPFFAALPSRRAWAVAPAQYLAARTKTCPARAPLCSGMPECQAWQSERQASLSEQGQGT